MRSSTKYVTVALSLEIDEESETIKQRIRLSHYATDALDSRFHLANEWPTPCFNISIDSQFSSARYTCTANTCPDVFSQSCIQMDGRDMARVAVVVDPEVVTHFQKLASFILSVKQVHANGNHSLAVVVVAGLDLAVK